MQARLEIAPQLRPDGRLFAMGLLRPIATDGLNARLVATRRTVAALQGQPPLSLLPAFVTRIPAPTTALPFEVDPRLTARAIGGDDGGLAIVHGPTGVGKTTLARRIAGLARDLVIEVDLRAASAVLEPVELAAELAELVEDAQLSRAALVVDDAASALAPGHPAAAALANALARTQAVAIVTAPTDAVLDPKIVDQARLHIAMHGLRSAAALEAWDAIAGTTPAGLALIGEDLVLTPRRIGHASRLVTEMGTTPMMAIAALEGDAGNLLQSAPVQCGLADIVLDPEARRELTEIINAIRSRKLVLEDWGLAKRLSRGRGLSALFDGDPGTGKTMAAEVIAHEVGLPLRKVNVSTLVDKYIGETEKNLARVFAQARAGTNILLFDEADALFGTRTEVKGANDRYANLEINVLLQLMEEHSGVVILTTNLKRSIDQAFLRRISYKLEFKFPEAPQRRKLWDGLLPAQQRATDLNLRQLAEVFPLSGGDIKSAVMRAAYRAAARDGVISMNDLVECAQLESEAMGRVIAWNS
ncbi:MAG: ATP-binding protein [Kofleriaceae bacterium]